MIKNILLVMGFTAARLGNPELPEAHLGEAPLPPLRKLATGNIGRGYRTRNFHYKNERFTRPLYQNGWYEGEAKYAERVLLRESSEKQRQAFDEAAFKKQREFRNEARQEKEHQMAAYADAEKRYLSHEKSQAELVKERQTLKDKKRLLDAERKEGKERKKNKSQEKLQAELVAERKKLLDAERLLDAEPKRGSTPKKERKRETETEQGTKPMKEHKRGTEPKKIEELIKKLDRARSEPDDAKTIKLIDELIEWRESAQTQAKSEMDGALRIAEQAMYSERAATKLLADMKVALELFKAAEPTYMKVEGHLVTARRNYNTAEGTEASVEARKALKKAFRRRKMRSNTFTELARKEIPRWGEANSPRAQIPASSWDGIEQRMAHEQLEMMQPIPFENRPAGREMPAVVEGYV